MTEKQPSSNREVKMQAEARSANLSQEATDGAEIVWPPKLPLTVLGALVAVGIACLIMKTMYPIFVVPEDIAILPDPPPTAAVLKLEKAQFSVDAKNFSILFGLIGAVFGASCVLFTFGIRSIKAIVIGAIAAGALGVVGANLSNLMFTRLRASSNGDLLVMGLKIDSMMQNILGYGVLWGLIGLGVGIGIGSVRTFGKSVVAGTAGLVGGLLAAMVYVLLVAQLTPNAVMSHVFPLDITSQAIWLLMFMVLIAAAIPLGTGEKRAKVAT